MKEKAKVFISGQLNGIGMVSFIIGCFPSELSLPYKATYLLCGFALFVVGVCVGIFYDE